jgi:hypothetical protein
MPYCPYAGGCAACYKPGRRSPVRRARPGRRGHLAAGRGKALLQRLKRTPRAIDEAERDALLDGAMRGVWKIP